MNESSINSLWATAQAILQQSPDITPRQLAFINLTKALTLVESTFVLATSSATGKEFLENQASTEMTRALSAALGADAKFTVVIDETIAAEEITVLESPVGPPAAAVSTAPVHAAAPTPSAQSPAEGEPAQLNAKYSFDTFIVGPSNRFAHAAAFAVAEAPGKAYNPLFIYGDSGLGKTHLLHAVGHYAQRLFPNLLVKYVNSEEFTNDFINALDSKNPGAFQRRYREVDLLLIDDIQFLQGKEATVEEFFHTFNTLHHANKQVVITSDVAPNKLNFEDRIKSRFEWGLMVDIQPPVLETRIAILRKKAASDGLQVPDDVLEYIASRISSNIRVLEGALIRVAAFASLKDQDVDLNLAESVLKDLITDYDATEITAGAIIAVTADYFTLSIDDICGASRSRILVQARQIAMYLCRELTDLSLPKIGQAFGGRDHTTVMHATKKVRDQMAAKRPTYDQVSELTNRIKQQQRKQ